MFMKLQGSCYCGSVSFFLVSETPYPYMRCYCSVCRKTNGAGGYAINLMGLKNSLAIEGKNQLKSYRVPAELTEHGGEGKSNSRRKFCSNCGSYLWVFNPEYDQWMYPFASAIDTNLPVPPERNHIMLKYKADWVEVPSGDNENHFETYPEQSIKEWHETRGLLEK